MDRVSRENASRPPETLGRYQLLRRLARGGMAELFLARATGLEGFEKLVVVKRILPVHAAEGEMVRMFLQEARLAATLHHPNIAQVYDIGEAAGAYFFSMEYVDGVDLRWLNQQVVPVEQVVAIAIGTAAGLHYAHERTDARGHPLGIVHRDVSPSNVLVGRDGIVKLVDFGIARAADHRHDTRPGMLRGKVAYMSPEQCRGQPLDRRSDLFSLGTVLYELATGTRLFDEESDLATMNRIAAGDVPPPSARRPGFPRRLEAVLLRALAADRQRRYQTAQELQLELESWARDEKMVTSPLALAQWLAPLLPARDAEATAAGASPAWPVTAETSGGVAAELSVAEVRHLSRQTEALPSGEVPRRRARRVLVAAVALAGAAAAVGAGIALRKQKAPATVAGGTWNAVVAVGMHGRQVVVRDGGGDEERRWQIDARGGEVDNEQRTLHDVTHAGGLVVAVGGGCTHGCRRRISTFDGRAWNDVELPPELSTGWLSGVSHGRGRWVAVDGTRAGGVLISDDGRTWSAVHGSPGHWKKVAFGKVGAQEMFVAVGQDMRRARSLDGRRWTDLRAGVPGDPDLHAVTIANGWVVAGGAGGRRLRSRDGARWTDQVDGGRKIGSIVFWDGKFLAYEDAAGLFVSADGARSWSRAATNQNLSEVTAGTFAGGKALVGFSWPNHLKISRDGLTWGTIADPVRADRGWRSLVIAGP
jgi:hypothetical protein